jgi:phosphatidylserine decarboxylase
MDPFVVVSFSKKVFRTRVLRHNLNPVWDEKLLFHVRRFEADFKLQFTLLDWDKLSGNDLIAETTLGVAELMNAAPKPDPETGIYPDVDTDLEMKVYTVPLQQNKEAMGDGSHKPMITFKLVVSLYVVNFTDFDSEQNISPMICFGNAFGPTT